MQGPRRSHAEASGIDEGRSEQLSVRAVQRGDQQVAGGEGLCTLKRQVDDLERARGARAEPLLQQRLDARGRGVIGLCRVGAAGGHLDRAARRVQDSVRTVTKSDGSCARQRQQRPGRGVEAALLLRFGCRRRRAAHRCCWRTKRRPAEAGSCFGEGLRDAQEEGRCDGGPAVSSVRRRDAWASRSLRRCASTAAAKSAGLLSTTGAAAVGIHRTLPKPRRPTKRVGHGIPVGECGALRRGSKAGKPLRAAAQMAAVEDVQRDRVAGGEGLRQGQDGFRRRAGVVGVGNEAVLAAEAEERRPTPAATTRTLCHCNDDESCRTRRARGAALPLRTCRVAWTAVVPVRRSRCRSSAVWSRRGAVRSASSTPAAAVSSAVGPGGGLVGGPGVAGAGGRQAPACGFAGRSWVDRRRLAPVAAGVGGGSAGAGSGAGGSA